MLIRKSRQHPVLVQGPQGVMCLPQPEHVDNQKPPIIKTRYKKVIVFILAVLFVAVTMAIRASAGNIPYMIENLFGEGAQTVDVIILLTVLSLLPSILLTTTAFLRVLIVMSFVRNALGMQQVPPNQVIISLALFITLFVMSPYLSQMYNYAYVPYANEEITQEEFIERIVEPARSFMLNQVFDSDLQFFVALSHFDDIDLSDDSTIPMTVLIPAFITSEIKHAFFMGFIIFLPFLVIDMVVASVLMAMGMMMLPPAMISLPFKVLLFVLVDGWQMILGRLITSFRFG